MLEKAIYLVIAVTREISDLAYIVKYLKRWNCSCLQRVNSVWGFAKQVTDMCSSAISTKPGVDWNLNFRSYTRLKTRFRAILFWQTDLNYKHSIIDEIWILSGSRGVHVPSPSAYRIHRLVETNRQSSRYWLLRYSCCGTLNWSIIP